MNLSFLSSIFKKDNKSLSTPDSIIIKQLKEVSHSNSFSLFNNVTIYHHSTSYHISLILLDETRGLYIFEKKEWSYDDLKDASIEKANNQESSNETLSYQNTNNLIDKKFNELTHNNSVPTFNYLLMENLNSEQYNHLNDSFKELLPKDRVIFNDSSKEEILKKLHNARVSDVTLPSKNNIIGNLLIQYTMIDENNGLQICTQEQIDFIDAQTYGHETLNALPRSGKSNSLILKSIMYILNNKDEKVIIIKPTILACDILKKKLLDIVEHAIIEIDLTKISILTPAELMKNKFEIARFIMCDDSDLYEDSFLDKLTKMQSKKSLLFVNKKVKDVKYAFTKSFIPTKREITFHKSNPHAKALLTISKLLLKKEAKSILIAGNSLTKEQLYNDLEHFIEENAYILDGSKNLINQDLGSVLLSSYADINELNSEHIILLDVCNSNFTQIQHAISTATKSINIIYKEECENINRLKEEYENNEE